jgi:hypothetical protein
MTTLPGLGLNQNGQARTLLRPEQCGKCKWHAAVAGAPHFECRRNPPSAHLLQTNRGLQTMCVFPIVMGDGWCGEYRPELSV